jgi:MSHA biogenesis protein MshI
LLVSPVPGAAAFVNYLKDNLYQSVEMLDLGQQINLAKVPTLADPALQGPALLAIGAALREEAPVST